MNFVLDTCVLSETIKPKPDAGLSAWLRSQRQDSLFVCTISLGELRKGIDRLPAGKKKHDLLLWLMKLSTAYGGRFLAFDAESAFSWGALSASLESMGKPMPVLDAMIAACTLRHGFTLVTRNEEDYRHSGVPLVNPYTEVQFVEEAGRVYTQAVEGKAPKNRFSRFRGSADVKLSTDEILALTRGE